MLNFLKHSDTLSDTIYLRYFAFKNIPSLYFLKPSVIKMTTETSIIKIPLSKRSKNHLNSMYFAALCAGADCAAGLYAMKYIRKSNQNVSLSFKNFKSNFKKLAFADTHFICKQNKEIAAFIHQVIKSKQRMQKEIIISAICPSISKEEVANFSLTLSLKLYSKE